MVVGQPVVVRIVREGPVGVIEINHPPVNALAHAVREPLLAAVLELDGDPTVGAIVIDGRGRHFIAGADIREFDAPPRAPLLHDVLARLEACAKPVVAALHGTALGGGAELALACHYRCASVDLSIGFPEVKLGLIPGSGGTVRLPRLVGLDAALAMVLSGRPVNRARALELGLVDVAVEGDVRAAAVGYAAELVARGTGVRPTCDATLAPAAPGLLERHRAGLSGAQRRSAAVAQVLCAFEATAALPFDEAMQAARAGFVQCRDSTESRALRYLFGAERSSASLVGAREVGVIGVVGAGTMGSGVAVSALLAGYPVVLVDTQGPAAEAGRARIVATLDGQAQKGRLSSAAVTAAMARLKTGTELAELADVDFVIEAVFESLEVKCAVFARLGLICRPGAILATNTSTLDVDAIATASGRPADLVGMHFFSPANVMRLVEVVRGRASDAEAVATTLAVTRKLDKIGVVVGNAYGFVGNRMLYAYGREKETMLLEGVSPERIDRALEAFGMAMGPNAVGDLAGLDIGFQARRAWKDKPADPSFYRATDVLAENGRYGQKTGRGFYRYEAGARRGVPDPEAAALIAAEANRLGVRPRDASEDEIVERCMLALINEGARLLDDGIAARAADIDVIWCNGYGFPRERGGPMFYADTIGLARIVERIRVYAEQLGARYWQPARGLDALAATGGFFHTPAAVISGELP